MISLKPLIIKKKLINSTNDEEEIFAYAKELFNKLWDEEKVRLIGLTVSELNDSINYQLSLFEESTMIKKEEKLEEIIMDINKKIGNNSIFKASNLK